MMRALSLSLCLFATACMLESSKDVPPVTGDDPLVVAAGSQKVSLDTSKVPVVASCAPGQYVRQGAGGWECGPLPAAQDLSSINASLAAHGARLTGLELARDAFSDLGASMAAQLVALELARAQLTARVATLEAATDHLSRR